LSKQKFGAEIEKKKIFQKILRNFLKKAEKSALKFEGSKKLLCGR